MRTARNARFGSILACGENRFTYDFGDDWRHIIVVEGIVTADDPMLNYLRLIDGARRAPQKMLAACPASRSCSGSWPIRSMKNIRQA